MCQLNRTLNQKRRANVIRNLRINDSFKTLKLIIMYKTNQQCWDEVTREFQESKRRTQICQEMFGQDNLKGLTTEQRDLFWESI